MTEPRPRVLPRRTKIVATVGPASDAPSALRALLDAGVDVVRLNLSHGSIGTHLARLVAIRAIAAELHRPIGVLADLPGPKIRAGQFSAGGIFLAEGLAIRLVEGTGPSTGETIVVDEPGILSDLMIGDAVVLGDGAITLRVFEAEGERVTAIVETGGRVSGSPGLHLPSNRTSLRAPTDEDLVLLEEVVRAGVEFVALSFVRSAADIGTARQVLAGLPLPHPLLIAKIETSDALVNLDQILEASDAVMVARGDLGIECPLEDDPISRSK